MKTEYTIAELAEAAGTSRRTIRYYIARELLQPPRQAGRNSVYGREHLERLEEIGRLKAQGLTLHEIGMEPHGARETALEGYRTENYELAADVIAQVRSDVPPWRMKRIRRILAQAAEKLRKEEYDEDSKRN